MSRASDTHWFLTDSSEPSARELSTTPVWNERDLQSKLRSLRQPGYPTVIALNLSDVAGLRIGLGDDYGFLQFYHRNSQRSGHMALAPRTQADELIEFSDQGAYEPIWPENLLPMELVERLILEFYRTQGLPESVQWRPRIWKDGDTQDESE
jgi:hypothetical protein